jgi:glycosyltransferase involved in cell wall biosynthesis
MTARSVLGLRPDVQVLLAVGRQEYQKGHDVLLEAFASLHRTRPDTHLVLAGRPGASTPTIERLLDSLGLRGAVTTTGHYDDVGTLFCAADVFVLPSRFEGLGGVLLEAMALETPIAASDLGPVRETVGGDEGAVLVPPERPELLAEATLALLDDPARRADLARRGRQRFLDHYTMDSVGAGMAALYRRVSAGSRS